MASSCVAEFLQDWRLLTDGVLAFHAVTDRVESRRAALGCLYFGFAASILPTAKGRPERHGDRACLAHFGVVARRGLRGLSLDLQVTFLS